MNWVIDLDGGGLVGPFTDPAVAEEVAFAIIANGGEDGSYTIRRLRARTDRDTEG